MASAGLAGAAAWLGVAGWLRARDLYRATAELLETYQEYVRGLQARFDAMWALAARQQLLALSMLPRAALTPRQAADYDSLKALLEGGDRKPRAVN